MIATRRMAVRRTSCRPSRRAGSAASSSSDGVLLSSAAVGDRNARATKTMAGTLLPFLLLVAIASSSAPPSALAWAPPNIVVDVGVVRRQLPRSASRGAQSSFRLPSSSSAQLPYPSSLSTALWAGGGGSESSAGGGGFGGFGAKKGGGKFTGKKKAAAGAGSTGGSGGADALKPKQQWDRYTIDLKGRPKLSVGVRSAPDGEWKVVGRIRHQDDVSAEVAVARQRALIAEHAKRLYPLQISVKDRLEWGYVTDSESDSTESNWIVVDKSVLDGVELKGLDRKIGFEGTPDPNSGYYCFYNEGRLVTGEGGAGTDSGAVASNSKPRKMR